MKRCLSLLLSLLLLIALIPSSAFAAGGETNVKMTVATNATSGKLEDVRVGDKVTVQLSVKEMTVSSFTCGVIFDKAKLECISIVGSDPEYPDDIGIEKASGKTTWTNFTAVSTIEEANSVGTVGFALGGTSDVEYKAGLFVTITFSVKARGNCAITLYEDTDGTDAFRSEEVASESLSIVEELTSPIAITGLSTPTKGNALDTDVTGANIKTSVEWYIGSAIATGVALANTAYTAKITVTPAEGYVFPANPTFTVNGENWETAPNSTGYVLTKTFAPTEARTTPTITDTDKPTAGAIIYGQTLGDSTLTAGTAKDGTTNVAGTFAWKETDTKPQVKDSHSTEYIVTFTPTDTVNYAPVDCAVTLTVNPKPISPEIANIDDQPYTGSQITPAITVTGDGRDLTKGTDYTVTYGDNVAVGTGTVKIDPVAGSNYTFAPTSKNFNIVRAIATITINEPGTITYDKAAVTAGTTGTDLIYSYSGDGEVSVKWYQDNNGNPGTETSAPVNAGTYHIGVSAEAGTNYGAVAEVTRQFIISPKETKVQWTGLDGTYTYTGDSQETAIKATCEGGNCKVTFKQNDTEVAFKDAGSYVVVASTTDGNYTLTDTEKQVSIGKIILTPAVKSVEDKTFDGTTTGGGTLKLTGDSVTGETPTATGVFTWVSEDAGTNQVKVTNIQLAAAWEKNYQLSATEIGATAAGKEIAQAAKPTLTAPSKTLLSSNVTSETDKTYDYPLSQINGIPEKAKVQSYTVKTQGTYASAAVVGSNLVITVPVAKTAGTPDSIVLTVASKNYEPADVEIKLEFKDKNDVTEDLALGNMEVTYGDLVDPKGTYKGTNEQTLWTYSYKGTGETTYGPSAIAPVDAGTYKITATYEDDVLEKEVPGHIGTVEANLTIKQKPLTLNDGTVSITKKYDGTTSSTGKMSGKLGLTGVLDQDAGKVEASVATVGAYPVKDCGTGYTILLENITLTGEKAANYTVPTSYEFKKAVIEKADPTKEMLTFTLPVGAVYNSEEKAVAVTAVNADDGLGTITVKYQKGSEAVTTKAPVNANAESETYKVIASLAAGKNYVAKDIELGTFTIAKADRALTVETTELKLVPTALTGSIAASTDTDADKSAKITYTSLNTAVAMVNDNGVVTAAGNGTTSIKVVIPATDNYNASAEKTVTIKAVTEPITGVTVSGGVGLTAVVDGTTITVTGTVSAGTVPAYSFTTTDVLPVTVSDIVDGKVTVTVDDAEVVYTIDTSKVTFLPAGITLEESVVSTCAGAEGIKDVLPQSVIDRVAAAAAADSAISSVVLRVEVDAVETDGVVTYQVTYSAEGMRGDQAVTLVEKTALPAVTGAVSAYLNTSRSAGDCFVKHTLTNGQVEYLPAAADSKGVVSFQTDDLSGTFEAVELTDTVTITFHYNDGSVQTVTYTAADIGKALPTDSKSGSTFNGWLVGTATQPIKTVTEDLLALDNSDAKPSFSTISSGGGGGGSSSSKVVITVKDVTGATITPNGKVSVTKGDDQTFKITPKTGYAIADILVDGKSVMDDATAKANGVYTYTMENVKAAHTLTVKTTAADTEWPFVDVADDYWAREAIEWAYEQGYMNGYSATIFNPSGSVTRQQLWMILARLSGEEPANMAEAKAWAVANGVSDGSNPGSPVTRQQMVTILYRYATLMGYKTTGIADLTIFPDAASVADYAKEAMTWSVANSIVAGTADGKLNPTGTANRAQFATILERFCEKIVK